MDNDRLQQLRTMLAEEPNDLFLRYAIALELKRAGEMEQAIAALEDILKHSPEHIASYYQLALMLGEIGRAQDAISVCEAGSLQCLIAGDRKARAELLELKDALND
ncbi:MAG: tetratricopeptide repeat protein [Flavobacteriales bacterium]|nr:MAG: tetratricopeptide repeat protein [Flavobacteriales bacterium]